MSKIIIDIKDKNKEYIILNLLKELSFVEFKELEKEEKIPLEFRNLFGIWKDREITLNELRSKAWQR